MVDLDVLAAGLSAADRQFVMNAQPNSSGYCLSQHSLSLEARGLCEADGMSATPLCLALRAHLKDIQDGQ